MKTKNIIAVLLITFTLASCAPTAPTQSSASATTLTAPNPTNTPLPAPTNTPTQILATPTETKPTNAVYLATTENAFPLEEVDGLAEFTGTMDFSNVIFTKPEIFGQTHIQAWATLEDGGQQFLVPISMTNQEIGYITLGLNATVAKDGSFGDWDEGQLREHIGKILKILQVEGKKTKVRILIGLNSGSVLMYGDLFPRLYADTNWDEATLKFMQSGNPNELPTISIFSQKILPAIRITIIDSN